MVCRAKYAAYGKVPLVHSLQLTSYLALEQCRKPSHKSALSFTLISGRVEEILPNPEDNGNYSILLLQ